LYISKFICILHTTAGKIYTCN